MACRMAVNAARGFATAAEPAAQAAASTSQTGRLGGQPDFASMMWGFMRGEQDVRGFLARFPRIYHNVLNYGTGQGAQEKALVTGRVISNRMERTIVVAKNNRVWDARLHFAVPRAKKYYAHDPMDACEVGDIVQIRPLGKRRRGSKTVTFELVNIVRRDPGMRFAESIARVLPYVRAAKGQDPALMREITPGR